MLRFYGSADLAMRIGLSMAPTRSTPMAFKDLLSDYMPMGWTVTALILRAGGWEVTAADDDCSHYVMKTAQTIEIALSAVAQAILEQDYWQVKYLYDPTRPKLSLGLLGLQAPVVRRVV